MGNLFSSVALDPGKPFGLPNYGNTCYVNSIFQVLHHTSQLQPLWKFGDEIINSEQFITFGNISIQPSKEKVKAFLINALSNLFSQQSNSQIRSILQLISKLSNGVFAYNSNQQDAHEFYSWLRERLITEAPFLKQLFEGKTLIETKCYSCNQISSRIEVYYDLQVQIQDHNSISQCIKNYEKVEVLRGQNKFFCSTCNSLQDAIKRDIILQCPEILCIQLKRFEYIESSYSYRKLLHQISLSHEIRIPSQNPKDDDYFFLLYAVVLHVGHTLSSGHYKTIAKTEEGWLIFDDENITRFDGDFQGLFGGINYETPYMLFYVKSNQWEEIPK